jgi:hypothetical protein
LFQYIFEVLRLSFDNCPPAHLSSYLARVTEL